jgi:hypothetical protein
MRDGKEVERISGLRGESALREWIRQQVDPYANTSQRD